MVSQPLCVQSLLSLGGCASGTVVGLGEVQVRKCSEGKRLQKCKLVERCGQSVLSATGTLTRAIGPVTWSLVMSLFQSPHTGEDLATTVAAREANVTISTTWEAEVTVSTAGETEGGRVPTEGPALSMSTQDPGEGATSVSSLECMLHWGRGASQWKSSL